MMERLKGKPSGDPDEGELVTRPDGTQAVRVRKRKRRSEQPQREEVKRVRRTRAVQVAILLSTLIVLALIVGGAFLYTNTPPFRKKLSDAVSRHLGADIEFRMFRVTPVSANADAIHLTWKGDGFLKEAKLRGISARISPGTIFGRSISGEVLTAREGDLSFQVPGDGGSRTSSEESAPAVRFDRVTVNKLGMVFGDPATAAFKVIASEASLNTIENKSWKTLNLHRGSLAIKDWPILKIDRGLIDIHPTEVNIPGLRVGDSLTPRGDIDFSGSINLLDPSARSTLNVRVHAFNLSDLVGPELGRLFSLRIDSRDVANSNYLAFSAKDPSDAELSVAFTNSLTSNNNLTGLAFLQFLGRSLEDKSYESPEFEEATGYLRRKQGRIELTELLLERKTVLCIKGGLTVAADKTLSGKLSIGLPESVIHLSPDRKLDGVFGPVSSGFRWVEVELSGTVARPADNFSQLYSAAPAVSSIPERPAGTALDPAVPAPAPGGTDPAPPADPGKAFEDLTIPR